MADSRRLFEALVQEHAHGLRIFLLGLSRRPQLADEAFQETLIAAWRNIDRFDQERSFGKWIRGIGRRVLMAQQRKQQRQLVLAEEDVVAILDERCEALQRSSNLHLDEDLQRLRGCIDALPPTYKEAIQLRYQKEERGEGLAELLGTSWENVKKRLQRGRRLLQDCMHAKWELEGMEGT